MLKKKTVPSYPHLQYPNLHFHSAQIFEFGICWITPLMYYCTEVPNENQHMKKQNIERGS